jgi:hypothetical protein
VAKRGCKQRVEIVPIGIYQSKIVRRRKGNFHPTLISRDKRSLKAVKNERDKRAPVETGNYIPTNFHSPWRAVPPDDTFWAYANAHAPRAIRPDWQRKKGATPPTCGPLPPS